METELTAALEAETQHAEIPAVEHEPLETPGPAIAIPEVPVQAVANQLGDVAGDTARLFELQIRLFEVECRQSGQQLIQPLAIFTTTALFVVASVVVVVLAAGTGLSELFGWPLSISLLLAAVVGLSVAALACRYALDLLKTSRISFEKSKAEFMRNIAFLSRVLKSPPT